MTVIDIFKYFIAFPDKTEALKVFSNGRSSDKEYNELLSYVKDMDVHSKVSSIKGFVFGSEEESINAQVSRQAGTYMFVEYGDISSSRDAKNSISNTWNLAISVLSKISSNCDPVEFAINSENNLKRMIDILRYISEDQSKVSWLKYISDNYELAPFSHKTWSAYGWTLLAKIECADLLDIKNM